jgi:hypothetical protein
MEKYTSRLGWEDKVKVQLFLCLINEVIWGSGGLGPSFLTLAIDGGKWSVVSFTAAHLYPRQKSPW